MIKILMPHNHVDFSKCMGRFNWWPSDWAVGYFVPLDGFQLYEIPGTDTGGVIWRFSTVNKSRYVVPTCGAHVPILFSVSKPSRDIREKMNRLNLYNSSASTVSRFNTFWNFPVRPHEICLCSSCILWERSCGSSGSGINYISPNRSYRS